MTDQAAATSTRRERRSQEEVRKLLLDAARERFAAHGFPGASIRTIAADAGASPQLVFNYFGSKVGLFEAAILEPFSEFLAEFNTRRRVLLDDEDVLPRTREFVAGMVDLLLEHRQLLLTVIMEGAREANLAATERVETPLTLARLITPTSALGHREDRNFVWEGLDLPTVTRATQSMIISMVVLDNLWYDGPERPPRDFMIEQLSRLLVDGYRGPRREP